MPFDDECGQTRAAIGQMGRYTASKHNDGGTTRINLFAGRLYNKYHNTVFGHIFNDFNEIEQISLFTVDCTAYTV